MNYKETERIDNFFEHSGILGQKWGRRRYQNLDGTLTEEGKARYAYKNKKQEYKLLREKQKYEYNLAMARQGGNKQPKGVAAKLKTTAAILGSVVAIGTSVSKLYDQQSKGRKFISEHILKKFKNKKVKELKGLKVLDNIMFVPLD